MAVQSTHGLATARWAVIGALALSGCSPEPQAVVPEGDVAPVASAHEPAHVIAAIARLPEFAILRRALADTARTDNLRMRSPVTLLAPRDTAFARMSPEARAALLAPDNREALTRALDGLIIPRILRADELRQLIADGGGTARIASRSGTLTFTSNSDLLIVTAPNGASATMGTQDIATGNGSVYVLDRWLGIAPTGE